MHCISPISKNLKATFTVREIFSYFSKKKIQNMSTIEHLKTAELPFEEKPLFVPTLEEIKSAICTPLAQNFQCSTVEIVDCPDLTDKKFDLLDSGLGGSPAILEIGSPSYLFPFLQKSKLYNLKEIVQKCMGSCQKIFAIGAGSGPYPLYNQNCEGIYNITIDENGNFKNGSHTARVVVIDSNAECILGDRIPDTEPRCAILVNMFMCNGECGSVLKIHCKKRTGEENFIDCIRKALANKFKNCTVGLGGTFLINKGAAKHHVMPDFSKTPIHTDDEVNNWLKFYNMPAKLNAVGMLITNEYDLDLRLSHFHSFSSTSWGGHYHNDVTPDIVEYEGYFNVAERVIRVDKPIVKDTYRIGRD